MNMICFVLFCFVLLFFVQEAFSSDLNWHCDYKYPININGDSPLDEEQLKGGQLVECLESVLPSHNDNEQPKDGQLYLYQNDQNELQEEVNQILSSLTLEMTSFGKYKTTGELYEAIEKFIKKHPGCQKRRVLELFGVSRPLYYKYRRNLMQMPKK